MIEVTLFRFDSKTDYLPYYKTYKVKVNTSATVNDLLDKLYTIEKFGYIKDTTFFVCANKRFINTDEIISNVINESNEILIEPISIRRALNDLIIDTKDYQNKLDFLESFLSNEEKQKIIEQKRYMLEYYASNTLNFNDDYIGEHVIRIALDLIESNQEFADGLEAIINGKDGIDLRTSLQFRMLHTDEHVNSVDTIIETEDIAQSFSNFNIALYCGVLDDTFISTIKNSGAAYIDLESKHFDFPIKSHKLSLQIAGTVLLEAKDKNADFLIVHSDGELKIFDKQQKEIEKLMGREIDLPVLTKDEFLKLLKGSRDISSHTINISFLAA